MEDGAIISGVMGVLLFLCYGNVFVWKEIRKIRCGIEKNLLSYIFILSGLLTICHFIQLFSLFPLWDLEPLSIGHRAKVMLMWVPPVWIWPMWGRIGYEFHQQKNVDLLTIRVVIWALFSVNILYNVIDIFI